MTVTYPYSLAAFADRLPISSVVWDVQRNDEMSGAGSGELWQAELSDPLWMGDVTLDTGHFNVLKQLAAMMRKLHGSQETFFLYDPMSKYPQSDPKGVVLGGSNVQIAAISADRGGLSLKGLPAGYALAPGDKMQVSYGASPLRHGFIEVSEFVSAGAGGITPEFGVFPFVPTGLAANAIAVLTKPACLVKLYPGSHNPGRARKTIAEGAAFKVIQAR